MVGCSYLVSMKLCSFFQVELVAAECEGMPPPWRLEASAPGKVILHGEHSVVYGKTGVVCSIDLRTKAVLRGPNPVNRKCLTVSLPDLGRSYDFSVESLRQFICCHSNVLLDASSTEFDQVHLHLAQIIHKDRQISRRKSLKIYFEQFICQA